MYDGTNFSEFVPGGGIYAARGRQCSVGTRSAGQGVYWRCICVVYRTRFLYIFYAPHVFSYRICYHMPHIEYISYYIFYT